MLRRALMVAMALLLSTFAAVMAQTESSIDNPIPVGTAAKVGDYTIKVVAFDADASEALVSKNEENVPPAEGHVYALISLDVTYDGTDVGKASSINWQFVGTERSSLTDTACASGDRTLAAGTVDDAGRNADIFPGGSVQYDQCVYLTTDDAQNVVMYTQDSEGNRVFFALKEGESQGTPDATPSS
jgi:hypothetical protein